MTADTQTLETPDTSAENTEEETLIELQEVEVASEDEDVVDVTSVLRTRRDGCWEVYNGVWGSYLRPTDDPDANVVIDESNLKQFQLKEGIHKIPAELWTRWVKLCFYFVDKVQSSVEVSIRILRSDEDPSQYRILVPKQKVSGASVRVDSFDESIDIVTGEEVTQYPPTGWTPVGSSHSHNTMGAFFSGIDDKYELDDPGIHLVVGAINTKKMTYQIAASVVGSRRRFQMEYTHLVDATWIPELDFHEKVIEYVDYTTPSTIYGTTSSYSSNYGSTWRGYTTGGQYTRDFNKNKDKEDYSEWWIREYGNWEDSANTKDPYYYNDGSSAITKYTGGVSKAWEVEDILTDYIKVISNNPNRLLNLIEVLKEQLSDAEVALELCCGNY